MLFTSLVSLLTLPGCPVVRIPEKRSIEDPNDMANNNILLCNKGTKTVLLILTSRKKASESKQRRVNKAQLGELTVNNSPIKCAIIKTGFGQKFPGGKGRKDEYAGQWGVEEATWINRVCSYGT